jgi:cholesterol transport system auxiliary component
MKSVRSDAVGRRALWPCLVALIALPGCVSGLNSKIPPQQSYVLQSAPVSAQAPSGLAAPVSGASVEVLRPSAAPGLEREGIAVLRAGRRLDFYNNARWAARAPAMWQALVIDSLRNAGRFAAVESDGEPFAAQYVLGLELQHFEAVYGDAGAPSIRVALVGTLGRRSDRVVIASFTARSEVQAGADRMQAVIAAFDQASGEALAQLAANIAPPSAN